ncbi:uncharacterized protein LOC143289041 isoform X2 [Babylonia areolata]
MSQQQQYRDPPPYPGHSKQVFSNQPGLRQSFSGSETSTDVSLSSTENLATWQRQEPQGEETQTPLYQPLDDGGYSILARLGMPPAAIESKVGTDLVSSTPSSFYSAGSQSYYSYSTHSQSIYATSSSAGREDLTNVYSSGAGSSRQSLMVPQHHWQSQGLPPPQSGQYSRARSLTPTYHHPHPYVNQNWTPGDDDISGQIVHNSQMLPYVSPLPPPPQYPGNKALELEKTDFHRSQEAMGGKSEHGQSQPDLSGLSDSGDSHASSQKGSGTGLLGSHTSSEPVFSAVRSGSSSPGSQERIERAVEILTEENRKLRDELSHCLKKVSKLQKFELEIQKVHEAYESLVKSSQKRERLEAAIKLKLEEEVKKLQSQNEQLTAQLQQQGSSTKQDSDDSTGSGQRKSHREVMEAKLAATQSSLSRLEDEVRKKDVEMGRMEKLQKAFSSLQVSSERREEMEKQLRTRLERELESYRSEGRGSSSGTGTPKEETKSVTTLKQILNEKETKILKLETEIVRWEQRYVELQAVQHMEESSGPQHAHLAALEKTSAETEKLIDEAKTEKLRHMEELYQSNRRVAELEARVKWLQAQLTEKEAMVKVYQRAPPSLPRSSSVHAICCSPHHSPRPSLIATTAYTRPSAPTTTTGSYCDFVNIRHVKTGSTSAIETGRKMSLDDTLTSQDNFSVSKSDSEDETRLWQV